jgi:hypothetical protein
MKLLKHLSHLLKRISYLWRLSAFIKVDKDLIEITAPKTFLKGELLIKNIGLELSISEDSVITDIVVNYIIRDPRLAYSITNSLSLEEEDFYSTIIDTIPDLGSISKESLLNWRHLINGENYEAYFSSREQSYTKVV